MNELQRDSEAAARQKSEGLATATASYVPPESSLRRSATGTIAPPPSSTPDDRKPLGLDTAGPAEDATAALMSEPFMDIVMRRMVTIPGLLVAWAVWMATSALLPVLLVIDLVRDRRWPLLRFWAITGVILTGQVLGGLGLVVTWFLTGFGWNSLAKLRMDRRVMNTWAHSNVVAMRRIYGMKFEISGAECIRNGPTIMLSRHASVIDTTTPIALLGYAQRVGMRIVVKRELLYSPSVDMVGHSVPFAFVRRGSNALERELAEIRRVARAMEKQETVMIYPEGTRFTEAKRQQLIEKFRAKGNERAAAQAESLQCVLPLRPAGTIELMKSAPTADLVFCAHTGLEGAHSLEDFVSGALTGRTFCVKFWRIPRAEVPTEPQALEQFLADQWQQVDQWIQSNRVGN